MARKRKTKTQELLSYPIRTRVNEAVFKKLGSILSESNCRSIGEVVRKILSKEKIVMLKRDMTLHPHIQELAAIRSELRSIGVNVNQITHAFHTADSVHQKMFHALKVGEEYAKVGDKVTALLEKVDDLGRKWLQR